MTALCFWFIARGKGKKKKVNEETTCPVCSEKIEGTSEELNEHVDQCLKQVVVQMRFFVSLSESHTYHLNYVLFL